MERVGRGSCQSDPTGATHKHEWLKRCRMKCCGWWEEQATLRATCGLSASLLEKPVESHDSSNQPPTKRTHPAFEQLAPLVVGFPPFSLYFINRPFLASIFVASIDSLHPTRLDSLVFLLYQSTKKKKKLIKSFLNWRHQTVSKRRTPLFSGTSSFRTLLFWNFSRIWFFFPFSAFGNKYTKGFHSSSSSTRLNDELEIKVAALFLEKSVANFAAGTKRVDNRQTKRLSVISGKWLSSWNWWTSNCRWNIKEEKKIK